jgi:hypothetical protein
MSSTRCIDQIGKDIEMRGKNEEVQENRKWEMDILEISLQ